MKFCCTVLQVTLVTTLWSMMWEVIFAVRYLVVVDNFQCHLCSEVIANPQMFNIIALLQTFADQTNRTLLMMCLECRKIEKHVWVLPVQATCC